MNSYTATIEVSKSPQEVFNCLTEITQWWNKEDFKGNSKKLNDEFIIHHPGLHYSKQKLVEVIHDRKIVWMVTESKLDWLKKDIYEWTNTKMIFEITSTGNSTILHFTHEGLTPEKECFLMCKQGWDMIIKNWLLHFITYGIASQELTKAAEIRNKIFNENIKSK